MGVKEKRLRQAVSIAELGLDIKHFLDGVHHKARVQTLGAVQTDVGHSVTTPAEALDVEALLRGEEEAIEAQLGEQPTGTQVTVRGESGIAYNCTFNSPADCEPVAEAGVVNSSVGDGRVQSFFDAMESVRTTTSGGSFDYAHGDNAAVDHYVQLGLDEGWIVCEPKGDSGEHVCRVVGEPPIYPGEDPKDEVPWPTFSRQRRRPLRVLGFTMVPADVTTAWASYDVGTGTLRMR
jgi:hypothetical protein